MRRQELTGESVALRLLDQPLLSLMERDEVGLRAVDAVEAGESVGDDRLELFAQALEVFFGRLLALTRPLGLERFGQCGDLPDLYRAYRLDSEAILDAAAIALAGGAA